MPDSPIPAILPRPGSTGRSTHQFVVYGDSCSGVPGGRHEETTAAVNRVVARLEPGPEFVCFLGDELLGLTTDEAALRQQWAYWFDHEMAWLDRSRIPLYHTTANHTTYNAMSERVYAETMAHLPSNGPEDQQHLSYVVRDRDLVMVFVNTMWTGLGEGRVELDWLDRVLADHADAVRKLVCGHHPVFTTNGFAGPLVRTLDQENGRQFWAVLRKHGVLAYLCSHMLAFDAQVHDGILQVMTAGAGTKHRMPEDLEYLHAVQMALDDGGLRYQVLDLDGIVRERLDWPLHLPPTSSWTALPSGIGANDRPPSAMQAWRFSGITAETGGHAQTLMALWDDDEWLPVCWVGLIGPDQELAVTLSPMAGRSAGLWRGPSMPAGEAFSVDVAFIPNLGPGGILWRWNESGLWSSMIGIGAWGIERLPPTAWRSIGHGKRTPNEEAFRGTDLRVEAAPPAHINAD